MALPIPDARYPEAGKGAFGFKRSATHTHQGVDVMVPEGTPVYAARAGMVEVSHDGPSRRPGFTGYGKVVVIKHEDGNRTLYAHLKTADVFQGHIVAAGEQIGTAGKTSYSKAPDYNNLFTHSSAHLHFEVSPRAYPQDSEAPRLDPIAWLRNEDAAPVEPTDPDALYAKMRQAKTDGAWFALGLMFLGALYLKDRG